MEFNPIAAILVIGALLILLTFVPVKERHE